MTRLRLLLIMAVHVAVVAGLLGWAVVETRRQQSEIERSLIAEASALADSLGPGLAAASNALRELDEIVRWKLLDNARLLAEIEAHGTSTNDRLAEIIETNGLDTVAFVDRGGALRLSWGDPPSAAMLEEVEGVLSGRAEELVHGSTLEASAEHIAVSVATASGGAVLVSIHPSSARTFVQRLGVPNLLQRVVGAGRVLYLSYLEEPGPSLVEATWDDGPVPEPPTDEERLHSLRGKLAFEAEVPVDAPAGARASLRVGLDGAALQHATVSGLRRTLLVGVVLAGYAIATVGLAVVSRLRGLDREHAARRLADAETARRRSERLAAAGALTAGLAHEVRSPLNAIGLAAQRLERRQAGHEECREFAGRIRGEVKRLESVLREFLDLAHPTDGHRESVRLGTLASEVIELLRPEADSHGVALDPVRGEVEVCANPDAIRRSLINLIRNAIEATPDNGKVCTFVEDERDAGVVRIVDPGSGIDPQLGDRVFEAFVTTRAGGAGLGLSLVKRVAEEHGGSCTLSNATGGGAEARLRLPRRP